MTSKQTNETALGNALQDCEGTDLSFTDLGLICSVFSITHRQKKTMLFLNNVKQLNITINVMLALQTTSKFFVGFI